MIVSQFYLNGNAKQAELVRAFGIQPLAPKRWVKKYRADGPKAFFETHRHLCAELNATETEYPGTDLRMIFKSVSS